MTHNFTNQIVSWRRICIALGILFCQLPVFSQANVVYYVPLPDEDLRACFKIFTDAGGASISNDLVSVTSIVITDPGTTIYYDHWEDGYEADAENPVQTTSEIWGDGNPANGIPPGYAVDTLLQGDVISLRNDVPSNPRNPANIYFDGSDKINSTRTLAVTRAGWPLTPGTVLAGAVEVVDTSAFDLEYMVPIGENQTNDEEMFESTGLMVMAALNNTTVQIDTNANGVFDVTVILNEGQSYKQLNLSVGAKVLADKAVQVHVITGDLGATYESRFFTLYPSALWDASYYNPVGTAQADDPVYIFLYNPDISDSLSVYYENSSGIDSLKVGPNGVEVYKETILTGSHFYTPDASTFFAFATVDSELSNSTHDWGFTLVPESYLTQALVVGWGPGSSDLTANGSPVWVTSIDSTTIYVDLDADPTTGAYTDPVGNIVDTIISLQKFDSKRLYDNSDNDQTGMKIYTLDGAKITAAYGQDPATSGPGSPYLDLGTTVPPNLGVAIFKETEITADFNGNENIDPGDTVLYRIVIINYSLRTRNTITAVDTLPPGLLYIPNSTSRTSTDLVAGDSTITTISDSGTTPFPFDEGGYVMGDLVGSSKEVIEFVIVADTAILSEDFVFNFVTVTSTQGEVYRGFDATPVTSQSDIELTKSVNNDSPNIGQTVTFTINLTNSGPDDVVMLGVVDTVPSGFTNISNINNGGTLNGNTITWAGLSIPNGGNLSLTFDADVDTPTGALDEYKNESQVIQSFSYDPDSAPANDDGDQSEDDEDAATINCPVPVAPGSIRHGG